MERRRSIAVIEDEAAIRDVVVYNLERAGFHVEHAASGSTGLELVRRLDPDLVVLDVLLPGVDGVEVCRRLRADAATRAVPVLMLTALGDERDVVAGLDAGADDYVSKPFSPRELVARVRARLDAVDRARGAAGHDDDREQASDPERRRVDVHGVVVDPARHEVLLDGVPVTLTPTELRLLHALLRRPGRVYTREQLVDRVMGDNAWVTSRTIDVHVRAIRRKLGERGTVVETIRGVGYRGRAVDASGTRA